MLACCFARQVSPRLIMLSRPPEMKLNGNELANISILLALSDAFVSRLWGERRCYICDILCCIACSYNTQTRRVRWSSCFYCIACAKALSAVCRTRFPSPRHISTANSTTTKFMLQLLLLPLINVYFLYIIKKRGVRLNYCKDIRSQLTIMMIVKRILNSP